MTQQMDWSGHLPRSLQTNTQKEGCNMGFVWEKGGGVGVSDLGVGEVAPLGLKIRSGVVSKWGKPRTWASVVLVALFQTQI